MEDTPLTGKPSAAPQPEPAEPQLAAELRKMPYEPLLPVEKKLVLWSILLGLFLLGVLVWANHTFFRG